MLGRFLEISLHTPDIQESLAFYESLGFVQATVGEAWPHPYAVVTDGHLFIGLHARPCPPLAVTYVRENLFQHVEAQREAGVEFDLERFDSDALHEAAFADPHGLRIGMVEARTFSPPTLEASYESTCGYFAELGIPVRDFTIGREFWEKLGFVAWDPEEQPFSKLSLTSDHLNLSLYRSRALRQPVLTFSGENMRERLARLREKNFSLLDEMPDSLDANANAVLVAPEGTRLLLLTSEE